LEESSKVVRQAWWNPTATAAAATGQAGAVLAILAPGQGAQTPGFLTPWIEGVPGFADRLRGFSDATDVDLVAAGTVWDAEQIRDTSIAQPMLVAAALATAETLIGTTTEPEVDVLAGHSVGEFAAAALSGALTAEAALAAVAERGRAMAAAAALSPTGMSAILGGDPQSVLAAIDSLGLTAANHNGAGQVVAAGSLEALDRLRVEPPAGARVIPLAVAGAFHTQYMTPAVERLEAHVSGIEVADPQVPVLSNADGAAVRDGAELVRRLVGQVATPVRWDLCMQTMRTMGVTAVIELAPGGTLTGLVKRAFKGGEATQAVQAVALKTPDDLPAARALLEEHAGATT
jgi:[acyl-carrier-protein] S-malonyltransferase